MHPYIYFAASRDPLVHFDAPRSPRPPRTSPGRLKRAFARRAQ